MVTKGTIEELLSNFESLEQDAAQKENIPFDPFLPGPSNTEEAEAEPRIKTKTRAVVPDLHKYFSASTSHQPTAPSPTVEAPKSALQTFKKLFRVDAPEKTGIPWSAFVSSMKSIGFDVEPVGGSVSKFVPPEGRKEDWKPINLHRPHPGDRIEGWTLLKLASRLGRRYGWGKDTFVAKK